ncbi:hypothetical protein C0585_05685 [Candidatus Woesearchaeota archaeon]|nr:MAG: hypothetical protein C0585_05685 [Candidatus Woesearchaeota archaeon]
MKLKKSKKSEFKRFKIIKNSVQLFFFALISFIAIRHMVISGREAAAVDAYCPFGAVESVLTYIFTGNFLPRIQISTFIIFGALVLAVIISNKGFCGWICPLGTFQEWISNLARKLKIPKINVSKQLDFYLRFVKYLFLIWIIYASYVFASLVFRAYDPFITLFHFGEGLIYDFETEKILAYLSLLLVIIGSLFIDRFWCKYACPLGAKINILALLSPTKITRDEKKCTECTLCDMNCPMNCEIMTKSKVKDVECIDCLKCVNICPVNALSLEIGGKNK